MSNDNMSSPTRVAQKVNAEKQSRHERDLEQSRRNGFREGLKKGHQDIVEWLQNAYLGPNSPNRGTPEAAAILKLARDASLHFQEQERNARGRR